MTRFEARLAIAVKFGATVLKTYEPFHSVVQFNATVNADDCKAVLDAIDPGFTGEVFGMARLLIANPDLHEEGT